MRQSHKEGYPEKPIVGLRGLAERYQARRQTGNHIRRELGAAKGVALGAENIIQGGKLKIPEEEFKRRIIAFFQEGKAPHGAQYLRQRWGIKDNSQG